MGSVPFLNYGDAYRVKDTFKSWFNIFYKSERVVYLSSATSAYDSTIGFFFWNIETGQSKRLDMRWGEEDHYAFENRFERLGPDMTVSKIELHGLNFAKKSSPNKLTSHTEYFKKVVEGEENIESWFIYVERHKHEFSGLLNRADFLRLVHSGYATAKEILEATGATYKESPRYQWLGNAARTKVLPLP
jgi:hypothetical protein